ncbi:hypothetical protein [Lichenifustis flavocetrariae]|nr:hypothetical protein [Lichenifustis flavocetrariae]
MIALDATDVASMGAAVDQIIREEGRIEVLIKKETARPTGYSWAL